MSKLRFKLELV